MLERTVTWKDQVYIGLEVVALIGGNMFGASYSMLIDEAGTSLR